MKKAKITVNIQARTKLLLLLNRFQKRYKLVLIMKHMDWFDLLGVILIFIAFVLARISLGELEETYPKPEYGPFDFRQIKDIKLFSLAFILMFVGILLFFVDPET